MVGNSHPMMKPHPSSNDYLNRDRSTMMPNTTPLTLVQSIQAGNFVNAKQQFAEIIQDKMRDVLAREYKSTADSFLSTPNGK